MDSQDRAQDYRVTQAMDALVLAGGESRRMGQPKALMTLGNKRLVDIVIETLTPMFRRVYLVTRTPKLFPDVRAQVVVDAYPQQGPLVGLATGLRASGAHRCFLVACDMPFIRSEVIAYMAGKADDYDVVLAKVGDRTHTLHAFYSQACLPRAETLIRDGVTSLRALAQQSRVLTLSDEDMRLFGEDLGFLTDIDTPAEMEKARDVLLRQRKERRPS